MYKILYYGLWRRNRITWYGNPLGELVSGNRQPERVRSARDILRVIPMNDKGMRERQAW